MFADFSRCLSILNSSLLKFNRFFYHLISIYKQTHATFLFPGITYANKGHHHQPRQNHVNNNLQKSWPNDEDHHEHHGPVLIQPAIKKQEKIFTNNQENDSTYTEIIEKDEGPKVMALIMEQEKKDSNSTKQMGKKKLVYKTMSGIRLKKPVRLQMWLDINKETFGSRTNPQCVHWSTLRG